MKFAAILITILISVSSSADADGDAIAGEKVFKKCASCHSSEEGKHKLGPSLFGVMGRQAGGIDGYRYSKSMMETEIFWKTDTLTEFLENPKKMIKGTKMAFPGIKKEDEMSNLLAYLETLN